MAERKCEVFLFEGFGITAVVHVMGLKDRVAVTGTEGRESGEDASELRSDVLEVYFGIDIYLRRLQVGGQRYLNYSLEAIDKGRYIFRQ